MKRSVLKFFGALGILAITSSSANAGCCIIKPCKKKSGEFAYVKKFHKVPVSCYKKRFYKVATKCIETSTCNPMTCYKTKVKLVPSTCYKTEAYMEKVWVDGYNNMK